LGLIGPISAIKHCILQCRLPSRTKTGIGPIWRDVLILVIICSTALPGCSPVAAGILACRRAGLPSPAAVGVNLQKRIQACIGVSLSAANPVQKPEVAKTRMDDGG
jgi:hypothetical protein